MRNIPNNSKSSIAFPVDVESNGKAMTAAKPLSAAVGGERCRGTCFRGNKTCNRRSRKFILSLPLLGIAVVCIMLLVLFIASRNVKGNKDESNAPDRINSPEQVAEYLSAFGWETAAHASSVKPVEIPAEFTPTYEDYNNLQKMQGFDLTQYRSQTATMYTFEVFNHPSPKDVFANVLVHDGTVIAGDLVCYALDGFITGLAQD